MTQSGGSPLTGQRLGAYELGPLIAAGGMGEVYAAYDPRLRRDVAIKVLPAALAGDPERLLRLEREARAAAALNHPNILAIHDIGTDDSIRYIVMERVVGETLAARLRRDTPPLDVTLDVCAQVADALAAVHAHGILHRDLKPANVMVTPEGRVKVLDFGLARPWVDPTTTTTIESGFLTHAGQLLGTPAYMAPEQMRGLPGGPRADIYSLGVMLYELTTGRRPFSGDDFMGAALRKLSTPAPDVRTADPSIPRPLAALITRCLAIDPEERPASAAEVKSELDEIRAKLPAGRAATGLRVVAARVAGWTHRRRASARPLAMIAAAAVAAGVLTYGVMRWTAAPAPSGSRPVIAVAHIANLTGDAGSDYLAAGIAEALTTSLSGLGAITVVARDLVREAERGTAEPTALAGELGLDMLVSGSLQRLGDRLRVDLRVIQAGGSVLWSGDSEASREDLFAMQRQLAQRLVDALRLQLSPQEQAQLARPPTSDRDALDAYWRGIAAMERNTADGFNDAIGSFQQAVDRDPRFAVAHAALGAAYVARYSALKDPDAMTRAAAAVQQALSLDPSRPEVRLTLANVYRETGRNASAVEELRRVLATHPGNDEARRRLGVVYESEGRTEDAREQYLAAVDNRPSYWRNHEALGVFYLRTGRAAEAIQAFTRVADLRPDSAIPHERLGTAYGMVGDRSRARQHFQRAIDIQPTAASYSNLATVLYADRQYEAAAAAYRAAVTLRPTRPLLRRNLGDAYMKLGRASDARTEYEEAVRLASEELRVNPNNARVMAQLAVYHAKLGQREDATRLIGRAVSMLSMDPEVLFRRAVVLALNGDTAAAMDAVSSAVSQGYSVELVKEDDDLSALRALPAFQSLAAPR